MKLRARRVRRIVRDRTGGVTDVVWRLSYRLDAGPGEVEVMEQHYLADEIVVANNVILGLACAGDISWRADALVGKWVEIPRRLTLDDAVAVDALVTRSCREFAARVRVAGVFTGEFVLDLD